MSDIEKLMRRIRQAQKGKLAPWELADAADALLSERGAEKAAEALACSEQHVRNLARLSRRLTPESRQVFVRLGRSARLGAWIKIAGAKPEEQPELVRAQAGETGSAEAGS